MVPVVIALGSNLGDSLTLLGQATNELRRSIEVLVSSSIYRSAPMYVPDQPSFFNGVITGNTQLGPRALLERLKAIERSLGRAKTVRNGPREIDLDLVVYGCLRYTFTDSGVSRLEVPHPRLHERRFVLEPLLQIHPNVVIPGLPPLSVLLTEQMRQEQPLEEYSHAPIPL